MRLPVKCMFIAMITFIMVAFLSCRKNTAQAIPVNEKIDEDSADLIPITFQLNPSFGGYYIQLPHLYSQSTENYPVIIFFHGLGQMGNGSTDLNYLLMDGIGKLLKDKKFPVSFNVNGKKYSFIVVSPQTSRIPTLDEAWDFVEYIVKTYRVDPQRLYISGLSLGSRIATLVGARYPHSFAAMLAIAGVALNPGFEERCKEIAEADLPVWEFHNIDDPMANVNDAKRFISLIGDFHPPVLPRMTIFDVYGHDAWTTALNPAYKENGMNVYEWMLQYTR